MPSDRNENETTQLVEDGVCVRLTHDPLDIAAIVNDVRSPKAGAIVFFAGLDWTQSQRH